MIYLLGVNHKVQYQSDIKLSFDFACYLLKNIKKLSIDFIGEEWSEEASKYNQIKITTTQEIAGKHNIPHMFCDPNETERKKLGILIRAEIKKELCITGPVIEGSENDKRITTEKSKL